MSRRLNDEKLDYQSQKDAKLTLQEAIIKAENAGVVLKVSSMFSIFVDFTLEKEAMVRTSSVCLSPFLDFRG
jgi:hypothetical protein